MLQMISIEVPVSTSNFDLLESLMTAIKQSDVPINHGDVIAIPSKYVSFSQGRVVRLEDVVPSLKAIELSTQLGISAQVAELLLSESDKVIGREADGNILTLKKGTYFRNGGIEAVDASTGLISLLPIDSWREAERIRHIVFNQLAVSVGVVVISEAILVGRKGTGGVALSVSGFVPIQDERGKPDLFGTPMKYTTRSIANMFAGAAQLLVEGKDVIVLIQNSGAELVDSHFSFDDMGIAPEQDLFSGSSQVSNM